MSYTFKAKCVSSSQNPAGTHTATLVGNGEQVVIPSKDMLFQAGHEYSISVDGDFLKPSVPAPKPAPVAQKPILQAQKPIAPVAPKPVQQPLQQQKPVVKP